MPAAVEKWLDALDKQRRALRIPLEVLAEQAGLSRATVCRILIDKKPSAHLDNVFAIARVLGATPRLDLEPPDALIEQHIQQQAREVVEMVQGTMALEAQGLTDPNDLQALVEVAAEEIRRKPRKQLWVSKCRSANRSQAKRPSPTSRS